MANEILVSATTGLTVTVQLYSGSSPVGSPIATSEVGTTGEYLGSMPGSLNFGLYNLVALSGGSKIASGQIYWTGFEEMSPVMYEEVRRLMGLDRNFQSAATQTTRTVASAGATDNINIAATGDQVTNTQMTRS